MCLGATPGWIFNRQLKFFFFSALIANQLSGQRGCLNRAFFVCTIMAWIFSVEGRRRPKTNGAASGFRFGYRQPN